MIFILFLFLQNFSFAADSYQVNHTATSTITEHGVCKRVTNNHASAKAIFVPTKTATEWSTFRTNVPPGVTLSDCGCTPPWGGNIAEGASATAYLSATVACGSSCTSQTRTCTAGVLSGSYTNSSCSVNACASCSLPWGGSIGHGSSVTAWAGSGTCGSPCSAQTRTCSNGSLSGSYTASSCSTSQGAGAGCGAGSYGGPCCGDNICYNWGICSGNSCWPPGHARNNVNGCCSGAEVGGGEICP
ncbi:MAG: hypothetical protein AB7F59_14895 [Bdellovibrionales bacterium]